MAARLLCSLHNLFMGCLRPSELDVVLYGISKEIYILEYK